MKPRIEYLSQKKLVGKSVKMSLVNNRTAELWGSFMPEKKRIKNALGRDLYSLQVYSGSADFNPNTEFTKWALIEVSNFEGIPEKMEEFVLEGGMYAVFNHKGTARDFPKTAEFIFSEWLPKSAYALDHRPHFEVLGRQYKNNDPDSEEEVWIPIKNKPELV